MTNINRELEEISLGKAKYKYFHGFKQYFEDLPLLTETKGGWSL